MTSSASAKKSPARGNGNRGSRKAAGVGRSTRTTASTTDAPGSASPAKKPKYNANGRKVGDQWCASDAEATRYEQLLSMQGRGMIDNLRCQVRYPLLVKGVKIATYVADFAYEVYNPDARASDLVIEEVKGLETPVWKMKLKLFEALYAPLKISVIKNSPTLGWLKEHAPDLAEQMVGKMGDFSHWIRVRWTDKVS